MGLTINDDAINNKFIEILERKGIKAAYEYLNSLGIRHKAMDFIIADPGQRLAAKRAALKVAPHIHASLLRQIGKDALEQAYDTALVGLQRDTTPKPAPSNTVSARDRTTGKAHPAAIDSVFGMAVKAMSGSDQVELDHRRAEALGLSPYLISGLSKVLGSNWPNVLDQLEFAWTGLKLKPKSPLTE